MKNRAAPSVIGRSLTPDQQVLGQWFAALLKSRRGPHKITKLLPELVAAGVPGPSYETLVKAARGEVVLPGRYADALVSIYGLTDAETAAFAQVVALAHMTPHAAALYRRSQRLPDSIPVPELRNRDALMAAV